MPSGFMRARRAANMTVGEAYRSEYDLTRMRGLSLEQHLVGRGWLNLFFDYLAALERTWA